MKLMLTLLACFFMEFMYTRVCESCGIAWFGSKCQYKCHCTEDKCDHSGSCSVDSTCTKGWFGPACQYADLAEKSKVTSGTGITIKELTDNDPSTCYKSTTLSGEVIFDWRMDYFIFTWVRFTGTGLHHMQNISVRFRNMSKNIIDCSKMRKVVASVNTLDIYCDLTEAVSQLILKGVGTSAICSVQISGGRNVALKQNASQTSTYRNSTADKAVDGNTLTVKGFVTNCSHTLGNDSAPEWRLQFSQVQNVYRFVLYNRQSIYNYRLKGFVIYKYDKDNLKISSYVNMSNNVQDVYVVTPVSKENPVSRVKIKSSRQPKLNKTGEFENVLTLCEVEMYGDSACNEGLFGRECERKCSCAVKEEACFVSTGGCPSGCAAGYYGEDCHTECPVTMYGLGCSEKCSSYCENMDCHVITGQCKQCIKGYDGPLCSEPVDAKAVLSVHVIIGLAVAIVLVFIIAIIIAIAIFRRRSKRKAMLEIPPGYDRVGCVTSEETSLKDYHGYSIPREAIAGHTETHEETRLKDYHGYLIPREAIAGHTETHEETRLKDYHGYLILREAIAGHTQTHEETRVYEEIHDYAVISDQVDMETEVKMPSRTTEV